MRQVINNMAGNQGPVKELREGSSNRGDASSDSKSISKERLRRAVDGNGNRSTSGSGQMNQRFGIINCEMG